MIGLTNIRSLLTRHALLSYSFLPRKILLLRETHISEPKLRDTALRQKMHQAEVTEWGQSPRYSEAPEPPAPGPEEVQVKLIASGVHQVTRSRAAGRHYSAKTLPHVPGVDGVGTTDDGQTVYFASFATGAMSEYVNLPKRAVMPLPSGVDPIQAAGIVNPAMSSWLAIKTRTNNLPKDFSVLIVGATSTSGRVAAPLARLLGAKRVIGAARNKTALDNLGLDEGIVIADPPENTDFSTLGDVDVILDYVYGALTVHLLSSLSTKKPVQYVHVGGLASMEMNLPGAVLRSKNLTLRGSGPGAWNPSEQAAVMPELLLALNNIPEQAIRVAKLADIEAEWPNKSSERLVLVA